ncbi:MAG: hypothetical protein MZW92_58700 [Comamonadaceae bacterium]|nr:hypothetical protein [Comamonadaceae bacterium]
MLQRLHRQPSTRGWPSSPKLYSGQLPSLQDYLLVDIAARRLAVADAFGDLDEAAIADNRACRPTAASASAVDREASEPCRTRRSRDRRRPIRCTLCECASWMRFAAIRPRRSVRSAAIVPRACHGPLTSRAAPRVRLGSLTTATTESRAAPTHEQRRSAPPVTTTWSAGRTARPAAAGAPTIWHRLDLLPGAPAPAPRAAVAAGRRARGGGLLERHLPVPPGLRALDRRPARPTTAGCCWASSPPTLLAFVALQGAAEHVALLGLRRGQAADAGLRCWPARSAAAVVMGLGLAKVPRAVLALHPVVALMGAGAGAHRLPHALRARARAHHRQRRRDPARAS